MQPAEEHNQRFAVSRVPFFVVNGRPAVSGAREPSAFLAAFDRAADGPRAAGSRGVCVAGAGEGPSR